MWKVALGGTVSALVLGTTPGTVIVLVKKLKARGELKRVICRLFLCIPFFMVCA